MCHSVEGPGVIYVNIFTFAFCLSYFNKIYIKNKPIKNIEIENLNQLLKLIITFNLYKAPTQWFNICWTQGIFILFSVHICYFLSPAFSLFSPMSKLLCHGPLSKSRAVSYFHLILQIYILPVITILPQVHCFSEHFHTSV